jgi:hypothetical protein
MHDLSATVVPRVRQFRGCGSLSRDLTGIRRPPGTGLNVMGDGHVPVSAHRHASAVRPSAPCLPRLRASTFQSRPDGCTIEGGSSSSYWMMLTPRTIRRTSTVFGLDDSELPLPCLLEDHAGRDNVRPGGLQDSIPLTLGEIAPCGTEVQRVIVLGILGDAAELVEFLLNYTHAFLDPQDRVRDLVMHCLWGKAEH